MLLERPKYRLSNSRFQLKITTTKYTYIKSLNMLIIAIGIHCTSSHKKIKNVRRKCYIQYTGKEAIWLQGNKTNDKLTTHFFSLVSEMLLWKVSWWFWYFYYS